jgi:hypothetical protein
MTRCVSSEKARRERRWTPASETPARELRILALAALPSQCYARASIKREGLAIVNENRRWRKFAPSVRPQSGILRGESSTISPAAQPFFAR